MGDIPDLSLFGLGVANNGGGTDGVEVAGLPAIHLRAGSTFWVMHDHALSHESANPFALYFGADSVFANGVDGVDFILDGQISQNGDDAIELFYAGRTVDIYGDINQDGSGTPWDYRDAFAYRSDTTTAPSATFDIAEWTVVAPDCSDASTNNCDSLCGQYPDPSFTCPLVTSQSPRIRVGSGPYMVGVPIDVLFDGATSSTDWIGFYTAGSDLQNMQIWVFHHNSAADTGELISSGIVKVTPQSPGDYFVAFLGDNGFTEIAPRIEIHVSGSSITPTMSISAGPYTANAPIGVTFAGASSSADWIGLYAASSDVASGTAQSWVYHHGTQSTDGLLLTAGTVQVTPSSAGEYYVAFLGNNGYAEIAPRIAIHVG